MRLEYNDMIRLVSMNLGVESPNNKQMSIIKRDMYMSLLKIMRKASPVKRTHTANITDTKQELYLPEDFFTAYEVIFKTSNGSRYYSTEVEMEQFKRWTPNVLSTESNFETAMLNESPAQSFWTKENIDLDGKVAYYFTDEEDVSRLVWKSAITGTVEVIYSAILDEQPEDVFETPELHYAFRELLILGPTIQGLLRKPSKSKIEMNEKIIAIRMYTDEYKQMLKEFAGYVNRTTSTPRIEPFDFLNDPNHTLWNAD